MSKRDLFVVVADLDAEEAIKVLLTQRQEALGIDLDFNPERAPEGDLLRYAAGHDSGCFKKASDLLRPPQNTHHHAMIIFDHHGSGVEHLSREDIESEVEGRLHTSGWDRARACAIVIDPELEAWAWSSSPQVADSFGWEPNADHLRRFLLEEGLLEEGADKPLDPKKAMHEACKKGGKPLGARIFAELAGKVSVRRCQDASFNKFRRVLTHWFPLTPYTIPT